MLGLDLKSTQTNLDLDWFYDMLKLKSKTTWTNLLDSDWFYYNQAGMLLKKSENLLELFVKQEAVSNRTKFRKFNFPRSDYAWCVNVKTNVNVAYILQELSKSKSNLIPFKCSNKSKSLYNRYVQAVSCQLFQEICIKSKNIISSRLSIQRNGVI